MSFKQSVYNKCVEMVNAKISLLQHTLSDLRDSAANETKSTAGDKHETALAMLQIEQANTGRQLEEAMLLRAQLQKINIHAVADHVVTGSLIETSKGLFFISVPLGKLKVEDQVVIILSPQSPLGKKLIGLKTGNVAEINGVQYIIESVD